MAVPTTSVTEIDANYQSEAVLEEQHGNAIYGVAFNHFRKDEEIFATRSLRQATIYRCEADGGFQFLRTYVDEDEHEEFYVCRWSMDVDHGTAILAFAGKNGVVRVLDIQHNAIIHTLVGHGQAINDISFFTKNPHILLSASKDESVRVWNVKTGVTICTVAGDGGHTAEVLSIDGHLDGMTFVTSGMDNCIKIWTLRDCMDRVELSDTWDQEKSRVNFPTAFLQYPLFDTRGVHGNYVDCVQWLGDLVISKGVSEHVVVFKPLELPNDAFSTSSNFTILLDFELKPCDVWYVRFSLDFECNLLACGDQEGRLHVWDISCPTIIKHSLLHHTDCTSAIRQTAISLDGSIILAACDSGQVWRWDLKDDPSEKSD